MSAYLGLFAVAFVAATLLPAQSEAALGALYAKGLDPLALWCWATAGNTLGAAVNWALGRRLLRYQDRRWFPFDKQALAGSEKWFNRYGAWTLLMAWAPLGGDALTFVAGVLRVPFWKFFLLTGLGKGARYAVVLGAVAWTRRVFNS